VWRFCAARAKVSGEKLQDHFIMAPLRAEKSAQHMAATEDFDSSRRSWDAQGEKACVDIYVQAAGSNLLPDFGPKVEPAIEKFAAARRCFASRFAALA
jgi:hypothetical protein